MTSVTLSTRMTPEELAQFDALAEMAGSDRSGLLKSLVRRGMKELRMENAVAAFRREQATLSRAAEIAGLPLWEFVSQMGTNNIDLHYDVEDFESDLRAFRESS